MGEKLHQYLLDLINSEEKQGTAGKLVLAVLAALSVVYRFLLYMRNQWYRLGLKRPAELPCFVISVGNITVGGTGKTPVVEYLARMLQSAGQKVSVLTRGYKSQLKDRTDSGIVSDYERIRLDADTAGDESLLLAQNLPGIPVLAGRNRTRSGGIACQRFHSDIIILDDGFQHRQLQRNIDIVVIDATNPFGNGYLLPRGFLREPVHNLARADLLIITRADQIKAQELDSLKQRLQSFNGRAPIFTAAHSPAFMRRIGATDALSGKQSDSTARFQRWEGLVGEDAVGLENLTGKPVTLVSGIGNPASFEKTIAELGGQVVEHLRFPDHYRYQPDDIRCIAAGARANGVQMVIMTEKDAVKLGPHLIELINSSDVTFYSLVITLKLQQEADFIDYLRRAIRRRGKSQVKKTKAEVQA